MSEKCSAECVCRALRFPRWYPCDSPAKVVRDGKPYCLRHDPERVKAKQEARQAIATAKYNKKFQRSERQFACLRACSGFANPIADVETLRVALSRIRNGTDEARMREWANDALSVFKNIQIT